jgi:hypothetical protein
MMSVCEVCQPASRVGHHKLYIAQVLSSIQGQQQKTNNPNEKQQSKLHAKQDHCEPLFNLLLLLWLLPSLLLLGSYGCDASADSFLRWPSPLVLRVNDFASNPHTSGQPHSNKYGEGD